MDIEVDTRLVEAAAQRAAAAASRLRAVAAETARSPQLVHEPVVAAGLAVLVDVVTDLCEVVALDLDLIERRLRAGSDDYGSTEARLASASGPDEGSAP